VIVLGKTMKRQYFADQRSKPPLHAIAHHGIANALGHRDSVPQACPAVRTDQQDKARS